MVTVRLSPVDFVWEIRSWLFKSSAQTFFNVGHLSKSKSSLPSWYSMSKPQLNVQRIIYSKLCTIVYPVLLGSPLLSSANGQK